MSTFISLFSGPMSLSLSADTPSAMMRCCQALPFRLYHHPMIDWNHISHHIGEQSGKTFTPLYNQSIGGGCISSSHCLSDGERKFFVKINGADLFEMFEAEAAGLKRIADTATINAPRPICSGVVDRHAYLVLEYIALGGRPNGHQAGACLAALHSHTAAQFGWGQDNYIGSTPQPNNWCDRWVDFWRQRRLAFQLQLAAKRGYRGRLQQRGEQLLDLFPALIDHNPPPSLIHGDLWSGNLSYNVSGEPVIYDPAIYFADREAELAMTELFGGFPESFYRAYNNAWPLERGYAVRKVLYNLYHLLNHLNLFGGGYAGQALHSIDHLLAELGH